MIKGKHIGLRAVEKEDLIQLRDWRNLPGFRKNFREVRELSLEDQYAWFESLQKTKHINYMFSIVDVKTEKLIGAAGLLYVNWVIRSADFSFYIGENEQYVGEDDRTKEAVELLLNYGFNTLNLNKIWMELYAFDDQKIKLFTEDYNFKVDGKLRENCFEDGQYWDSLIISLLKKEYRN